MVAKIDSGIEENRYQMVVNTNNKERYAADFGGEVDTFSKLPLTVECLSHQNKTIDFAELHTGAAVAEITLYATGAGDKRPMPQKLYLPASDRMLENCLGLLGESDFQYCCIISVDSQIPHFKVLFEQHLKMEEINKVSQKIRKVQQLCSKGQYEDFLNNVYYSKPKTCKDFEKLADIALNQITL